jgi:transcription termination/antitermination protein NusA
MSREILLLVDALAHEKNVSKEVIFTALELALASATKKTTKKMLIFAWKLIAKMESIKHFAVGNMLNMILLENSAVSV